MIWEFWNEPNIGTSTKDKGYITATAYAVALTALGESLASAGLSDEALVGPAAFGFGPQGFDLPWMRKVFELGGNHSPLSPCTPIDLAALRAFSATTPA